MSKLDTAFVGNGIARLRPANLTQASLSQHPPPPVAACEGAGAVVGPDLFSAFLKGDLSLYSRRTVCFDAKCDFMSTQKAVPSVYQLKITLLGIDPPIWRGIHVPSTMLLSSLHDVLQAR